MSPSKRQAFTLIELLAVVGIIGLLVGMLLPSLARAREQAKQVYCANNLSQFGRAIYIYTGEYGYFAPHNPYPQYWPEPDLDVQQAGIRLGGWDPSLGWLMAYGMRMDPPERFANGHFKWYVLGEDELPDVVVCPSARREVMFEPNIEIDTLAPIESYVYQYAAFYQVGGTCRAATTVVRPVGMGRKGLGGRNPLIADCRYGLNVARPVENTQWNMPYVWIAKKGLQAGPSWTDQMPCWVQAVQPSELDSPGRVYYMADSREYRPSTPTESSGGCTNCGEVLVNEREWGDHAWPPGTTNDGWHSGWGNRILLGTRHRELPNVLYMDGRVSTDNVWYPEPSWNMAYDKLTETARSERWRASTFADEIAVANLRTGHHLLPVLQVKGWEDFFKAE